MIVIECQCKDTNISRASSKQNASKISTISCHKNEVMFSLGKFVQVSVTNEKCPDSWIIAVQIKKNAESFNEQINCIRLAPKKSAISQSLIIAIKWRYINSKEFVSTGFGLVTHVKFNSWTSFTNRPTKPRVWEIEEHGFCVCRITNCANLRLEGMKHSKQDEKWIWHANAT